MIEMEPIEFQKIMIKDDFWTPILEMNAHTVIFNQWDQLEKTFCIDNFRIVAGQKKGFREGLIFADSDA